MNIDSMCRVCEIRLDLKNIFHEENEKLLLMLRRLANISIQMDDLLPKEICNSCAYRLQMAYEFKMLCEMTDKTLRARLEKKHLSPETPVELSKDTVPVSVKMECSEQYIYDAELNLDYSIVKEEFLLDDGLVEKDIKADLKIEWCNGEGSAGVIENVDSGPIIGYGKSNVIRLKDGESSRSCKDDDDFIEDLKEEFVDQTENPTDGDFRLIDFAGNDTISNHVPSIPNVETKTSPRPQSNTTHNCIICPANFTDDAAFKAHKLSHGQMPFRCNLCDKSFSRKDALANHITGVHSKTKVPCHLCDKKFSNRSVLLSHIRQCHENRKKRHVCHICDKKFFLKSHWRIHLETHSDERKYACDICHLTFKTAMVRYAHTLIHKKQEERKQKQGASKPKQLYICDHCGKQSFSEAAHANHIRKHSRDREERQFVCEVCSKSFRTKQSLDGHMLYHSGERPHTCDQCGQSFRYPSHLESHKLSIHEQVKPYACQFCGRCFLRRGNLRIHERLHEGEKSYKCGVCPLRFKEEKKLRRHRCLKL